MNGCRFRRIVAGVGVAAAFVVVFTLTGASPTAVGQTDKPTGSDVGQVSTGGAPGPLRSYELTWSTGADPKPLTLVLTKPIDVKTVDHFRAMSQSGSLGPHGRVVVDVFRPGTTTAYLSIALEDPTLVSQRLYVAAGGQESLEDLTFSVGASPNAARVTYTDEQGKSTCYPVKSPC